MSNKYLALSWKGILPRTLNITLNVPSSLLLGVFIVLYGGLVTSLVAQMVKASAYNAGDLDSIPGSGRSPREGNGNPLQYSSLENPMDGGAW